MNWLSYFKKWAPNYEKEVEEYGYDPEELLKPFLKHIGHVNNTIDVGCGTGKSLEVLSKISNHIVGIEPVEKMAEIAEKKGFEVLRMKAEQLYKLNEKFDLITFFASIDFVNVGQVVKACKKLLNTNGQIFLTIEPENQHRILEKFLKNDFLVMKSKLIHAYRGHDYICVLLK